MTNLICYKTIKKIMERKRYIKKCGINIRPRQWFVIFTVLVITLMILFKIVFRRMLITDAPPIWKVENPDWFNITSAPRVSASNTFEGSLILDPENIFDLLQHKHEQYRLLGHAVENGDFDKLKVLEDHPNDQQLAMFHDVVVSSDGWILHSQKNLAVRNGGCYNDNDNLIIRDLFIPKYKKVISIAVYWGHGIWHFPMEALVGLMHINEIDKRSSYIHVSSINNWVLQWLRMTGIDDSKVISGTISAETLVVPKMGVCGSPSVDQIHWLRRFVIHNIVEERNSVLLIKRTRKRVVPNFEEVTKVVKQFAKEKNLDLIVHDDSALPPFHGQLKRFAKAVVVIGPHGAGMVNLLSSKVGTCVIEFLPNKNANICYLRLSYLLGHNYIAVPLYADQTVNIQKVDIALQSCTKPKYKIKHIVK